MFPLSIWASVCLETIIMGKVIASAKLKSCRFIRNVLRFSVLFSLHEEISSSSSSRRHTKSHSLMELPFGHIKHKAKQKEQAKKRLEITMLWTAQAICEIKDTQFHHSLTKNDVISLYNNIVVELWVWFLSSVLLLPSFALTHFDDHYIFFSMPFSRCRYFRAASQYRNKFAKKKTGRATEMREKICLAVTLKWWHWIPPNEMIKVIW